MAVTFEDLMGTTKPPLAPSSSDSSPKISPESLPFPSAAKLAGGTPTSDSLFLAKPSEKGSAVTEVSFNDLLPQEEPSKGDNAVIGLFKGLGQSYAETAKAGWMAVGGAASLVDKSVSLASGIDTTMLQDAVFQHAVDPLVGTQKDLQLAEGSGWMAKGAYAVGSAIGVLTQILTGGGETKIAGKLAENAPVAAKVVDQVVRHGLRGIQIPALTTAVETGNSVMEATGDKNKALDAAVKQYILTSATFASPVAAPGTLGMRAVTGAATSTVIGESSRIAMNENLPEELRQPFSWENLVQEGVIGAGMGAVGSSDPYRGARVLREMGQDNFDQLVVNNPKAAAALVKEAAKTDPKGATKAAERAVKVSKMGLDELREKGKQAAELKAKTEAEKKKAAAAGLEETWNWLDEEKPAEKPTETPTEGTKPVAGPIKEPLESLITEKAKKETAESPEDSQPHVLDEELQRAFGLLDNEVFKHFNQANRSLQPIWSVLRDVADKKQSVMLREVFSAISKRVPDGPVKDMVDSILRVVPDIDLIPRDVILDQKGNPAPDYAGLHTYGPGRHDIQVVPRKGTAMLITMLHEATHAAKVRWMYSNPDHPLTKEANRLYGIARDLVTDLQDVTGYGLGEAGVRYSKWRPKTAVGDVYGMTDVHEFMAEVRSNPKFQTILARAGRFAQKFHKLENVVNKIGETVRKMLGVSKEHGQFLNNVLNVSDQILEKAFQEVSPLEGEVTSPSARGQISKGLQEASYELEQSATDIAEAKWGTKPVIYTQGGLPVTAADVKRMTKIVLKWARTSKSFALAEGKLTKRLEQAARTVLPEALGDKAKLAANVVAKRIAQWKAANAQMIGMSDQRREFWNKFHEHALEFIDSYETGKKYEGPYAEQFEDFRQGYKGLMEWLATEDKRRGIKYEDIDNYITHLFDNPEKVAEEMKRLYGRKFGDPYFMKDRVGKSIKELVAKGYKLKYSNPEDIMQARVAASNIAWAKIEMLQEMADLGLAVKLVRDAEGKNITDVPHGWSEKTWRSPNGERYYVHDQANAILHNAFETKSLWTADHVGGDLYRGGMWLKNKIVPIRLFGLFHAAHVGLLINNAAAFTRAGKLFFSGNGASPEFWKALAEGGHSTFTGWWDRGANRILQAYRGEIPGEMLSDGERRILTYMTEGGFVPGMAEQDIGNSRRRFTDAVQKGKYAEAAFRLPFAAIDYLQYPLFHHWIPTLKIAAYTKDVATAMHIDPELATNATKRMNAFAQIRKSVDNRFGEMNYDTLFWNRTVKDIAVLNTLSVGWQLGFIREYIGGAAEIPRAMLSEKSIKELAKSGQLDRAMFATTYIAGGMLIGALITKLSTGENPDLLDYFYPRTGEVDENGKPKRINTPFFTREFASIYTHMRNEGVVEGLGKLVTNKASGIIALTKEIVEGVNGLGQEVRDPNAPFYKKLGQTLESVYKEVTPISLEAVKQQTSIPTKIAASAGFSPAPKYATETPLEGEVSATFSKYHRKETIPYKQAQFNADKRILRKLYLAGSGEYDAKLEEVQQKYDLSQRDIGKLESSFNKTKDPYLSMFKQLNWQQQKQILDKHWDEMSDEQKEEYLKASNRDHLRYKYEGPEK